MEASRFVRQGKRPVCGASLWFFSLLLIVPGSLLSQPAEAQSAATPATQTAPATPPPVQTPEERARVLREAQERIGARREARIQQTIRETYGNKYEAYFGGGYLRFHPGDEKQHINEGGWNGGVTDYIRPKLGLTIDTRGYYGTAYVGNNPYGIFLPSISQYSFLFGPQYRLYIKPKWGISVQGLAGFGHGNFDTGTGGLPASYLGLYSNGTAFSASINAPIDYNLSPGLALRVTPTYLITTYGSSVQNNLGFNMGVTYRWGKR